MSFSFSKEDVRKHLLDLGYKNITNEQLHEFMNDLKRLIRYEEKQKRIEAHISYSSKLEKDQHQKSDTIGKIIGTPYYPVLNGTAFVRGR